MNDAHWNHTLWCMRVLCPLVGLAAAVAGYFAWRNGSSLLLLINVVLLGINIVLTYMQWFVFKPRR